MYEYFTDLGKTFAFVILIAVLLIFLINKIFDWFCLRKFGKEPLQKDKIFVFKMHGKTIKGTYLLHDILDDRIIIVCASTYSDNDIFAAGEHIAIDKKYLRSYE
ncbi:MAG: hypothetical protein V4547_16550 [Bacteroidota bacterium]